MFSEYRSNANGISSSRITMLVEAHWRVLKMNYLVMHNRPRLDFVVRVISSQIIVKYVCDYNLCLLGLNKGDWRIQFVEKSSDLSMLPINNSYETSVNKWWCSYPSLRVDNFQLCKHLCRLLPCPVHRTVHCSRHIPFYKFHH